MLVVKNDLSCAVYSVGKTGSTSLLNSLDSSWSGTGEQSPDFMFTLASKYYEELYRDRHSRYIDQRSAIEYLGSIGTPVYCLIRNPWQRYVSGLKEIIQDSISALGSDMFTGIWQHLMNNPAVLTSHIDRLYYLTEYKPVVDAMSMFAIHSNYHTRNWLHEVEHLINAYSAKVIMSGDLDGFITDVGLEVKPRQNVSDPKDIRTIESALHNAESYCRNSLVIRDYVNRDIQIFNRIAPAYTTQLLQ